MWYRSTDYFWPIYYLGWPTSQTTLGAQQIAPEWSECAGFSVLHSQCHQRSHYFFRRTIPGNIWWATSTTQAQPDGVFHTSSGRDCCKGQHTQPHCNVCATTSPVIPTARNRTPFTHLFTFKCWYDSLKLVKLQIALSLNSQWFVQSRNNISEIPCYRFGLYSLCIVSCICT